MFFNQFYFASACFCAAVLSAGYHAVFVLIKPTNTFHLSKLFSLQWFSEYDLCLNLKYIAIANFSALNKTLRDHVVKKNKQKLSKLDWIPKFGIRLTQMTVKGRGREEEQKSGQNNKVEFRQQKLFLYFWLRNLKGRSTQYLKWWVQSLFTGHRQSVHEKIIMTTVNVNTSIPGNMEVPINKAHYFKRRSLSTLPILVREDFIYYLPTFGELIHKRRILRLYFKWL